MDKKQLENQYNNLRFESDNDKHEIRSDKALRMSGQNKGENNTESYKDSNDNNRDKDDSDQSKSDINNSNKDNSGKSIRDINNRDNSNSGSDNRDNSHSGSNKSDNRNNSINKSDNNNSDINDNNDNNNNNDNSKADRKSNEDEKIKQEKEDLKDKKINEYGQTILDNGSKDHKIHLLSIIGEIEGHEVLPQHNKTTKYEHVLPQLAAIEDSTEIDGLLILINTVGGDVEAGLAIAEMIASLSKPTVSLVLGGSHSIGVPLSVSADYSYIVPTASMIIHPVRMNGMVIGVTQTYEYIERIQDRIISFVVDHSKISYEDFKKLMLDTKQLAKDVGSILVGEETVQKGIIDEVGGIKDALAKINTMIDERKQKQD